ncbi:hypothetical protein HHI36_010860 [Cryptolaemus montrouzieri]|uniref:Nose resistant-to-fluoxetine protein N-terminal domain-containing protein n=1 Tax=Cryptolaemus montrouzieri TaxID=559131 RepID=A0ABD2MK14_9CUCU
MNSLNTKLEIDQNNFNGSIQELFTSYVVNSGFDPFQVLEEAGMMCARQLFMLVEGIRNGDLWALKMLDAASKLQSGILYGNIFNFGNYDECIEIKHTFKEDKSFKGQYCTASLTFGNNNESLFEVLENKENLKQLGIMFGLCVPSGCDANHLMNISNNLLDNYLPGAKLFFYEEFCSTEDTRIKIPTRSVVAIIIFAGFGVVIGVATFVDLSVKLGENSILKCFSLYTNGKKLLTPSSNEDSLNCLNGIRVLSMMLIVLGHKFIMTSGMPALNKIFVEQWKNYLYNYIFIGLGFAVDTFFTVSGLLVVYLYFRTSEKGREISWIMYYLHRLLRLTPSLLMLVLFYTCMLQFMDHPMFPAVDMLFGENCREYWWSTVLYIQNYWNPNDICAIQTWYLAIDTQLYIVAPLLLIMLSRYPPKGILCILVLAILSMGAAFEVTWRRSLGATYLNQDPVEYKYLYTPTHIRVPPWLFGALTGYFIAKNKDKIIFLSKFQVYSLWILSLGALLFVLLIQKCYHNVEYDAFSSGLYNAFARPIWGIAICIIILLCVFGYGGLINTFLSCNIFNILIRINYAIYLIQMPVILAVFSATFRTPAYLSDFSIIHDTLGDYCLILIVATFWTLAFESPIIALEKVLFSKGKYGTNKYVLNKMKVQKGSCETVIIR